jgi:hypothetical protein
MSLLRLVCATAFIVIVIVGTALGQTESASIAGKVTDTSNATVTDAEIELRSVERGTTQVVTTNSAGIYEFSSVQPGQYRMAVRHAGFRQVDLLSLVVNVQDRVEENFRLQVGSVTESITVSASAPLINTQDASVSTVVDRNFADNLPMNGRSFQSLIYLTPGVIAVAASDSGQFSVNGQRPASNYWTVDGVSANVGSSADKTGNQAAGAVGLTSIFGTTNSLVSVDAMQEFRIQTSTFAPEFGRTPGAQISIVTRSGTNKFHGSAFDYLRNDIFDANNWFNGYTNQTPLPKAKERQNDFGGTFSGPIAKNKTFFFFSYEGFRLRLPITVLTTVPDASARENATPALRPFFNAFPFDPKQPDLGGGVAQFNASASNPGTLDAYSLRIDHKVTEKLSVFGRYNNSPSAASQRAVGLSSLSNFFQVHNSAQQLTIGSTWALSSLQINEFRFNYSRTSASGQNLADSFGGAVPVSSFPYPSPFNISNAFTGLFLVPLQHGILDVGALGNGLQRQINVVDSVTKVMASHNVKFGVDYRRLTPVFGGAQYTQFEEFQSMSSAENGDVVFGLVNHSRNVNLLFQNLSLYAQDTWHIAPRFTLTYGLRWDTDFAPTATSGPSFPALRGVGNLNDLSGLAFAPAGTPAFGTAWTNLAPRIGIAYHLFEDQNWGTVIRGGFGSFYDLATSETANIISQASYPYSHSASFQGVTFPLAPALAAPPAIVPPDASNPGVIAGFDPNFKLPYTLQWNVAIEQGLGAQQSVSITYLGSVGRRLIQSTGIQSPNPSATFFILAENNADSNYNALQVQLKRHLARNLQLLTSYSWSHSIDSGSSGSISASSNTPSAAGNPGNRGSSDFDVRSSFSAGLTYAVPDLHANLIGRIVTHGWSLQSIIQAQSARPVPILNGNLANLSNGFSVDVRPDVVPGIPFYLYGRQYPGGKAINNTVAIGACSDGSDRVGPFCTPPLDINGLPIRQGDLPRNVVRGFGLVQWDLGVHRDFLLHEAVTLQFRAEMFNVLNHPNFAPPNGDISNPPTFGIATEMLGQYLSGGSLGAGGLNSLYESGSPRSMQFALKLTF